MSNTGMGGPKPSKIRAYLMKKTDRQESRTTRLYKCCDGTKEKGAGGALVLIQEQKDIALAECSSLRVTDHNLCKPVLF